MLLDYSHQSTDSYGSVNRMLKRLVEPENTMLSKSMACSKQFEEWKDGNPSCKAVTLGGPTSRKRTLHI